MVVTVVIFFSKAIEEGDGSCCLLLLFYNKTKEESDGSSCCRLLRCNITKNKKVTITAIVTFFTAIDPKKRITKKMKRRDETYLQTPTLACPSSGFGSILAPVLSSLDL
jgi:hypothetical protein